MWIIYYIVIKVFRCIKKTLYLFSSFFFLSIFFFLHFPEPNIGKKIGMDDLEFWVQGKKRMLKMIKGILLLQGTFLTT